MTFAPDSPARTDGPVRVAILDDYQGVALEYGDWGQLGPAAEITVFRDHLHNTDALVDRLEAFDVVVAMRERTPFPRSTMVRLPHLKLLVTTAMGNAAIDMVAASDLGIVVSGTGGLRHPTGELTWALILGLMRHVAEEDRVIREGGWQATVGADLAGTTLGLLGLGHLGRQVAGVGQAFGMNVIAWSQNLQPAAAEEVGVEAVGKEELFRRADVLSVHLQLSERTRGIVGASELALLKPTAYFVNTSRGPLVDEAALVAVLAAGSIAGAALDVFDIEPLPADHPLRSAPRTLLTPHIGYVTDATYRIFHGEAAEDVAAYLAGQPIRVINA
jgi:phosphoglycerate dehydrogenase-like enzyme